MCSRILNNTSAIVQSLPIQKIYYLTSPLSYIPTKPSLELHAKLLLASDMLLHDKDTTVVDLQWVLGPLGPVY